MFLYYPFFRWSTKPQFSDTYLLPAHSRNVLPAEPVGLQPSKQKNACLPAPHSLFCLQHPRQPLPTHGPRTSPDSTSNRARAPAHPPHRLPQNALPSSIRHSPASTGESPSARGEKGQFCPWRQETGSWAQKGPPACPAASKGSINVNKSAKTISLLHAFRTCGQW